MFVLRNDAAAADILYQVPIATYQAYNNWGGKSLYDYNSTGGRAYKVSYDRPYDDYSGAGFFFLGDYNMIRWLELHNYNVTYVTSLDTQTNPRMYTNRKIFLSDWHDEYWSKEMRDNLTHALDQGEHLAFFGANNIYWQIRFESSTTGRANRVEVCYKNASLDPFSSSEPWLTTVNWRSAPVNKPENALLGVMYESQFTYGTSFPWIVTNSSHWIYNGTGLKTGETIPGLVGYEYDKIWNNGSTPAGLTLLSSSPIVDVNGVHSTANGAIYTAASNALVFTAGTIYWVWKLDDNSYQHRGADRNVQRMTSNVLNAMINRVLPHPAGTNGIPSFPFYDSRLNIVLAITGSILLIALFIVLGRVIVRRINNRIITSTSHIPASGLSAMEILYQRYARGEIDTTTFEQMRERLKASNTDTYSKDLH